MNDLFDISDRFNKFLSVRHKATPFTHYLKKLDNHKYKEINLAKVPVVKERIKKLIQRFKELQGSPAYLSKGVAVGVFIGVAPLMPLKTLLILSITFILPSSTIAAFLVTTIICNPITYVPLYYVAWFVGNFLIPGRASWSVLEVTITKMQQSSLPETIVLIGQTGFDTAIVVLAGGCVLALPFTFLSYPLAFWLFNRIAKNRNQNGVLTELKKTS